MITEKELTNPQFLNELKTEIDDIINEDQFREAYDLSKVLSSALEDIRNFKEKNFDLYSEYKKIINRLKWIGLPIMVPNDVVKMFQYHFKEIFKIPDFDLGSKLKIVLLGIILLDERDKFKKQLREALLKNEEKITRQRLIINNIQKEPTVANWLSDYNQTLGTGEIQGLARTEYLVNGKNIKNLTEEEKVKIKMLVNLYEKLKLSSLTFEGLEDEISLDEETATGVIKEGVFEPFKPTEKQKQTWQMIQDFFDERRGGNLAGVGKMTNVNDINELKNMAASYPAGSFERKAIEEEIAKMNHE